MKSYKLNKTLENSTYPIEQELKKINNASQTSALKTTITVSTILFSGIATSFIEQTGLFADLCQKYNGKYTPELISLLILLLIYLLCILINYKFYSRNKHKNKPKNMKKKEWGREKLAEIFHKSIINDIVVGLSFLDKTHVEAEEEIKKMYLYEATYYFFQAINQINEMKIYDESIKKVNIDLIKKIGYETLLTTLIVFQNGVKRVMGCLCGMKSIPKSNDTNEPDIAEYKKLYKIYNDLNTQINVLKTGNIRALTNL